MKRMTDIAERAAASLSLPGDSLAAVPRLTLTGRRQLLVENHKGLLALEDDCVEIACAASRVRVLGASLQLAAMDRDALLLTGVISAIEVL